MIPLPTPQVIDTPSDIYGERRRPADQNGKDPPSLAEPSLTTVKTLFALSRNTCAYDSCEERLTDPAWSSVKARVCHIAGSKPGSARHDPNMSDVERHGFDNLILLCPNHHSVVDELEPRSHPVERLREMKERHSGRGQQAADWASEQQLLRFATAALDRFRQETRLPDRPREPDAPPGHTTLAIPLEVFRVLPRELWLQVRDLDENGVQLGDPAVRVDPDGHLWAIFDDHRLAATTRERIEEVIGPPVVASAGVPPSWRVPQEPLHPS